MKTFPEQSPTPNTDTMRKPRGPRSLTGKSFALVYNSKAGVYESQFDGRTRNIRFASPVQASGLIDPLAGGMLHASGRHKFKLGFTGDVLTTIINITTPLEDGEEHALVESVNVPFDSELAKWIRVVVDIDVVAAARLK